MVHSVDPRTVSYFVAVVEAGSFTRAAAQLGVAQSWLSTKIKQFEDENGFPLFVRSTRTVELTPNGQRLLPYTREYLDKWQALISEVKALANQAEICVAISPLLHGPLRMKLLEQACSNSGPQFRITTLPDSDAVRMLQKREIDVMLHVGQLPTALAGTVESKLLTRIEAVLRVPPQHPMASRSVVTLADLDGLEICVPDPRHLIPGIVHASYEHLEKMGAVLRFCPDPMLEYLSAMAERMGIPALVSRNTHYFDEGWVCVPFAEPGYGHASAARLRACATIAGCRSNSSSPSPRAT